MKMRFGGAAGPIAFERMRRMHNGSWDTITVPMGLALRTSALLEPLAAPDCALVDEKFYEFGGSRGSRGDATQDAGELSGKFMATLSEADLPDIEYARGEQRFVLRKNLLDPPYCTKLWRIELGEIGGEGWTR